MDAMRLATNLDNGFKSFIQSAVLSSISHSIYPPSVSMEMTTAQAMMLALFASLLDGQIAVFQGLLEISEHLPQLHSSFIGFWLRDDFNFRQKDVAKVLSTIAHFIQDTGPVVPDPILIALSRLEEKYDIFNLFHQMGDNVGQELLAFINPQVSRATQVELEELLDLQINFNTVPTTIDQNLRVDNNAVSTTVDRNLQVNCDAAPATIDQYQETTFCYKCGNRSSLQESRPRSRNPSAISNRFIEFLGESSTRDVYEVITEAPPQTLVSSRSWQNLLQLCSDAVSTSGDLIQPATDGSNHGSRAFVEEGGIRMHNDVTLEAPSQSFVRNRSSQRSRWRYATLPVSSIIRRRNQAPPNEVPASVPESSSEPQRPDRKTSSFGLGKLLSAAKKKLTTNSITRSDNPEQIIFVRPGRMDALHHAARYDLHSYLRSLLEAGEDVNAQDSDGWTPLHHAAFNGHYTCAKLLLEAGADPHLVTTFENSALNFAKREGHRQIEKLLRVWIRQSAART